MIPMRLPVQTEPAPEQRLPPEAFVLLNHLRAVALACRPKPRMPLLDVCARCLGERRAPGGAHSEALMRCLAEALGRPARLHAPGTVEVSFDEAWLVQLAVACSTQDISSLTFLLRSRVGREHRRIVRYLMSRVAEERCPV